MPETAVNTSASGPAPPRVLVVISSATSIPLANGRTESTGTYLSEVTDPIEPGQLGIARARQRNIDGWVAKRHPGTPTDAAAKAAASPSSHTTESSEDQQ